MSNAKPGLSPLPNLINGGCSVARELGRIDRPDCERP